MQITKPIEIFKPEKEIYPEITLIDAYDSFTHNLVQAFLILGAPVRVFRSKSVTLKSIEDNIGEYLVLSPGPGIPDTAGILKDAIRHFYGNIPLFGVCLGMQALNEVFGGETVKTPIPVHGKVSTINHNSTGVFKGLKNPTPVARYHSLMVENVPSKFKIQSTYENVIMAFHEPKKASAVQFHPESFLTAEGQQMIKNFLEGEF